MIIDIEVLTGTYESSTTEAQKEVLKGLDISYYDKNGEVAHKIIELSQKEAFTWQYVLPGDRAEPGAYSWDKKAVRKAKSIKLSKFRIEEILQDRREELAELFEFNIPKKYVIDIETEYTDRFSPPEAALNKVTAISIVNCTDKRCTVLAIKGFDDPKTVDVIARDVDKYFSKYKEDKWSFSFFAFDTEYDMLSSFFGKFIHKMPLITGWNVIGYDWPYLVNRADRLNIDPSIASTSRRLLGRDRLPQHRLIVDYLDIVKKWDRVIKIKENYKLDYIAEQCTGLNKVKYQGSFRDLYEKDFQTFIFYNAVDSILVHYIDQKLNTLQTFFKLGDVMQVELNKVFSPVATQDALMAREFYKRGLYSVDVYDKGGQDRPFEGAYVKEPAIGLHLWVSCLDFASLYPNAMMQWNISPETLIGSSLDGSRKEDQILCANGKLFSNQDSVLRTILGNLYAGRKVAKEFTKQINVEIDALKNGKAIEYKWSKVSAEADYTERLAECDKLTMLSRDYKSEEQAIKLVINSIYGALGNKWLTFFNPDVAETITLQGQDLIKYADKMLNRYFKDFWHKDAEVHARLGITTVGQIKTNDIVVYCDTDSAYLEFDEVLNTCDWRDAKDDTGNPLYADEREFILAINKYRLKEYLNKCFDAYALKWGTVNQQDFELENINAGGIWLAKKKYLLNTTWQDGISIDHLGQLTFKGVELAQSGTPVMARAHLKELVKHIFTVGKKLNRNEFVGMLRRIKDEYKLADTGFQTLVFQQAFQ